MTTEQATPRDRILDATARLLAAGGREAVSTRAVSNAAGVQPPTIYRQFGDMAHLLDAVASHGFAEYLRQKRTRQPVEDPVDDLRAGWDLHVEFGITHPAIYRLMYGSPGDRHVPAAREAAELLRQLVQRVAEAGRLTVSVDQAVAMIHAAGVGVVLLLNATAVNERPSTLSTAMREAVLSAVTSDEPAATAGLEPRTRAAQHAVALKALLAAATSGFRPTETALLQEWLDRLARPSEER